jgi:hypothetical protein
METFFDEPNKQLFAAEFDYFRIPPEKWELMLTRLKQMGINTLAITLPWGFHEFKQGTIDLNGATNARRSIKTVLKLSRSLNFYCILNPGPYAANRGILGDGLPLWFYRTAESPETDLHSAAEGWLRAISKTLAGAHQWPYGPIIALQLNCMPAAGQNMQLSQQITRVRWPIWLRQQYKSIEALNAAYGTNYKSVNQVDFPQNWHSDDTPATQDAQTFLTGIQQATQKHYLSILTESGWQVPVYPQVQPNVPPLQYLPADQPENLNTLTTDNQLIILQHPIQVYPDPVDVGQQPSWANKAPIRANGSLQQNFWQIRRAIWHNALPETTEQKQLFLVETDDKNRLISCQSDSPLNLAVPAKTRPAIYRLRSSGQLEKDETIKVSRGKIKGNYLSRNETDQTDMLFTLANPKLPVTGYLQTYLVDLLLFQAQTLNRCANLAETLGQTLAPPRADQPVSPPEASAESAYTLNTLEEARRGLREADVALKKAISSIDSLENGFAAILNSGPEISIQPATATGIITPEIFKGHARETLIEIGATCAALVQPLNTAGAQIQEVATHPDSLTVDQYQQAHGLALDAAQAGSAPLLEIIRKLRQMIGADEFPSVFWRIHDQVQHITEALRWGVERGA